MGLEKELRANEIVWLKKETYNTIVDRINNPRTYGTTQARGSKSQIDVRNASNEIIPLYGVVEVKEPTITPTDDQDRFNVAAVYFADVPDANSNILGVIQRELQVEAGDGGGVVAQVITHGLTTAIVDVKNIDHEFCKVSDTNTFHLESTSDTGPIRLHFASEVANAQKCKVFIGSTGGAVSKMFPLDLVVNQGGPGDNTGSATWTYNVYLFETGEMLLANASPIDAPHRFRRPNAGQLSEADFGYGCFNADGDLVIGWVNEQIIVGTCADAPPGDSDGEKPQL